MKSKPITCVVLVFLFVFSIWPCQASIIRTIPNVSIIDPSYATGETSVNTIKVKELLSGLGKDNPALAFELGKLPELQDGITSVEISSLERLVELYNENPNMFNNVFVRMNRVGITEVRKYCVPLQAIYWLVRQRRMEEMKSLLGFYSQQLIEHYMDLNVLLVYAWNFADESE